MKRLERIGNNSCANRRVRPVSLTLQAEAIRAAKYVFNKYKPAQCWGFKATVEYVQWNISQGFLGIVTDDNKDIVALGIARPVSIPGDGAMRHRFDPGGDTIFIDLMLSDTPLAIPGLCLIFQKRFGERKRVAFFRRAEEKLRIHSYRTFLRNVTRQLDHDPIR